MSASTTGTPSTAVTLHVGIPTFVPLDFFLGGAAVATPGGASSGTLTVSDPTVASATLGTMMAAWATAKVPAGALGGVFSGEKAGTVTATYTDGSLTASLSLVVPSADAVTWDVADAVQEPAASSTVTTSSASA